jgi:hypothetical protein
VLGFGASIRIAGEACECVSYLKIDWSRAGGVRSIDERLRSDPAILVADRVAGDADYRLFSRHADYRAANAWARELLSEAGVSQLTTRFCARVSRHSRYAAARLAADACLSRRSNAP